MSRGPDPKIAQLPQELRELVERRLQDGHTYQQIATWLAENGHPEVSVNGIGKWYRVHHQKWVRQQMRKQVEANGENTERKG